MSKDHIGVAINGVLYVKFEDAKKLREGWDKADAEIEKLRAALQTARRDALKEAAQMASNRAAAWAEDAIGKFLETKWDYESRAEAGEEIAFAILARAALGEKE